MKKCLFVLTGLVISILTYGQGKIYLMPEVGINSAITSDYSSNFQKTGLNIGLNIGVDLSENIALESGLMWSKVQAFPSVTFYDFTDGSNTDYSFRSNTISSNGFFSIPLHLKISHFVWKDKLKVFTFFGPRYITGNLSYSKNNTYNGASYDYSNAEVSGLSSQAFEPGFLFDGGFGFEYKMNSKLSLTTKGSYSLGTKRINANFDAARISMPDLGYVFEDTKWKGDGVSLSVGVKIKF